MRRQSKTTDRSDTRRQCKTRHQAKVGQERSLVTFATSLVSHRTQSCLLLCVSLGAATSGELGQRSQRLVKLQGSALHQVAGSKTPKQNKTAGQSRTRKVSYYFCHFFGFAPITVVPLSVRPRRVVTLGGWGEEGSASCKIAGIRSTPHRRKQEEE